jgi:thiol-disulfide isomerase/thioredoxin
MSVDLFHFLINTTAILRLAFLTCALGVSTSAAQQPLPTQNQPARDAKEAVQPEGSATAPNPDDARTGILTLIDGSQVPGQLHPTSDAAVVHWLARGFTTPFQFKLEAIESIKYPRISSAADGLQSDEFAIEFSNRDIVYGNIVSWDAGFVTVQTQAFGDLVVPTECITRLYRVQENDTVLFARFKGLESWSTPQWQTKGWQESGNYLSTEQRGAVLNGDLGVPIRSVIELTLSWKDQADFVISLGSDVTSTKDQSIDGWRLETAGQKLIAVRESKDAANLAFIADLSLRRDLRLTFYLDQAAGKLHAMRKDGKLLATLLTPNKLVSDDSNTAENTLADGADAAESRQTGIRIVNRGKHLTVERVSIARWLGELPNAAAEAAALVALNDGTFAAGSVEGIESGELSIGQNTPKSKVDWDQVTAITFRKPDPPPAPAQCALFLQNGIRLSGTVVSINEANCTFVSANSDAPSQIPRKDIRSIIVFSHEPKPADVATGGETKGQLQIGDLKLTGILAPSDAPTAAMQFKWQPYGSDTAATMNTNVAGNILYRKVPKPGPKNAQARAQEMQRLRIKQQQRGLNFGELFLKRADEVKTPKVERDSHVVHVRTGDIISCRVDRIDSTGAYVSTIDSKDGFVSHEEIKAIEYVTNAPPPDLEAAKRERLLTIPRLQKSAPPTHILCSHNGDFLRCRLIEANADTIRVEVQLAEIKLPRDRIAQIIWLHPQEDSVQQEDASESISESAQSSIYDGLAQVLLRDGKRVTFKPTQSTKTHVSGESAIIGPCTFPLETVDQLIIGKQILTEVTDIAYNRWKLQSAIEPLVTAAMEQGTDVTGSISPLIGQPAPEVSLQLLDGTPFKLSAQTGKIVVLDFWATWCAPCMQTMPLVDEAIKEFDGEMVKLVSVNLQESAQQIQPVLERYNLKLTVALDTDGVAAARYEARAIPQLVIIGKEGVVRQLYVGGGSKVVDQMSAAIKEMLTEDAQ